METPSPALPRPLAVIAGASSGIGYELAMCCARDGYDLIIAADDPGIVEARQAFEAEGAAVMTVQADLSTIDGVDQLLDAIDDNDVDVLIANAGHGLGHAFLDQPWEKARRAIDTNVTGTCYLLHECVANMRDAGRGKVLLTGAISGLTPGGFQAVYNATKAFIDSFSLALRNELEDSGVTVTCLMPSATDTEFFERARMLDTKIGAGKKADPAKVAKAGYEAMQRGEGDVVAGVMNKPQAATGAETPQSMLAGQTAGPGAAED